MEIYNNYDFHNKKRVINIIGLSITVAIYCDYEDYSIKWLLSRMHFFESFAR